MQRVRGFRSPHIRQERRRERVERIQAYIALFGALVLLFSQIAYSPIFRLQTIRVSGNETISKEAIGDIVSMHTYGSYGYLFPKSNTFLIDERAIETDLREQFVRIAQVTVKRESRSALSVYIEERQPAGKYCRSDDLCFVLDGSGFVYAPANREVHQSLFTYYGTDLDASIGTRLMDPEMFRKLNDLLQALQALRLGVTALHIGEKAPDAVSYETIDGAKLIFDMKDSFETQVQNFEAVITSKDFLNDAGSSGLANVEYVDLRFGSKVFYRLHGE